MDMDLLTLVAYILSSDYRKEVLGKMYEYKATTPTKLSKDCEFPPSNISPILQQLGVKDLVVCVNPEVRKGKIFCITELGEKVYENLGMVKNMIECCGNCRHYSEAYCSLMDDLVEPLDNCGMFNGDEK